jgi:hypothetical protein
MVPADEYVKLLLKKLKRLIGGNPQPPEDLYSCVGAPRKPRLPTLSAAAVAERPDE